MRVVVVLIAGVLGRSIDMLGSLLDPGGVNVTIVPILEQRIRQ